MVMTTLDTILSILPVVSLTVVLIYYTTNVRAQFITRQVQMFTAISKDVNNEKLWKQYWDSFDLEWTDFKDFDMKYGRRANPEVFMSLNSMFWTFGSVGSLLKEGMIKRDRTYELVGAMVAPLWERWSPVIEGWRNKWGTPESYIAFEYICKEMTKMHEQGYTDKVVKKYRTE